ncbi:MAG: hypothetical protein L0K47_04425 [Acidipropionibacterium jensenii]|uniref:DUF5134 domain-containing protein n=1 Tax=Acidipropionibacterium jensenii TaxID=1749 RepID=UPI0026490F96|nr:DUF5134 domain-containing protein [Acidipropionibacterium jensenii]MDN6512558.1 hypothetical protein [Acidipropionibacterium jensenii]
MFTLTSTPVTFIGLLILFIWCTLWSVRDLLASLGVDIPPSWAPAEPLEHGAPIAVSECFHLAMSVVMLLMVPHSWWGALPGVLTGPVFITVMALGTLWMGAMAAWKISWLAAGHTAMFAAMVWHLASMASHSRMGHSATMTGMGDMAHSGMAEGATTVSGLTLITGIGLPLMVCLVVLGLSGLVRAVTGRPPHPGLPACCHPSPTTPASARLSGLADAAMGLGMAWMSAGLMAPLLPFMGSLTP